MGDFSWEFLIWATSLGALSAASLPIGSVVGLSTTPRPQVISIMAAFGAGALIAALSVELVAPTVAGLHQEAGAGHHGSPVASFYALLVGLPVGGVAFVVLDQLVNLQGGFLRKTATSMSYFLVAERKRREALVARFSQQPLLQNVPAEHINALVSVFHPVNFLDGEVMQRQEDPAKRILFFLEGTVLLTRDGKLAKECGPNESIGVAPLLTDIPSPTTATAKGVVKALALSKADFEDLRNVSPEFDEACRNLSAAHLDALLRFEVDRHAEAAQWAEDATEALKTAAQVPTAIQLRRAREEHHGAPLAIWLGILLDGIPESLVIGAGLLVMLQSQLAVMDTVGFLDVVPFTLIAGLFLSNYPEALASSANMKLQGWSKQTIFWMWFSLMVITAIGAGLGYLLAGVLDPTWLVFAEGIAAGAMLTMIAAAMIPEAVLLGSANGVGISTLTGFLAAISFKLLE